MSYENLMPDYICKDGKHYHLFIAKGTKEKNKWTVGYSNYENELSKLCVHEDLTMALIMLTKELEKTTDYGFQIAMHVIEQAKRDNL